MWSDLTKIVRVSPNCSSREGRKIERITVHHSAGKNTVEGLLDWFATPWEISGRQASANYVIGNDGKIGGCVPEELRAWTSGSKDNDTRAITIEVSNDVNGEPWSIGSKAWNSAVNLCADICMRYGFRLKWHPIFKTGTLTCHRWYQDTTCPGDWFYSRIPEFIEEVNRKVTDILNQIDALNKKVNTLEVANSKLAKRLLEVEDKVAVVDERTEVKYHTIKEVPDWARPTIQKLINKGYLKGQDGNLALTYELVRELVINDRAGVFDLK